MKHFLTVQEVARETGACEMTIRRMIRAGRLRVVQPTGKGGRIFVPRDAFLKTFGITSEGDEGAAGGGRA